MRCTLLIAPAIVLLLSNSPSVRADETVSIGGSNAVFFVSPAAALFTLLLVYRLARKWFDEETGLFAAAIVVILPGVGS